jgi:hypothetical protein
MNTDIRLKVSFLNHRKRKKLQRALGAEGVLAFIDLMLSAATNRPDGILAGLNNEDIALDAQWDGDADKFVDTLLSVGLLDMAEGGALAIHDWQDHNSYASDAEMRSDAARFYNLKKYYPAKAKVLEEMGITTLSVEDYAKIKAECSGKLGTESVPKSGRVEPDSVGAPLNVSSTFTIPEPEHTQDAGARVDQVPTNGDSKPMYAPGQALPEYSMEFEQLWDIYPRKEAKESAWIAFKAAKGAHAYPGNPIVLPIVVQWAASPRWNEEGGKFIPMLSNWISGKRWEDETGKLRDMTPQEKAAKDAAEVRQIIANKRAYQ